MFTASPSIKTLSDGIPWQTTWFNEVHNDFLKPQAFHEEAIPRSGGIASIICLFILFGIYYLLFHKVPYEYVFLCSSLFVVGYLDDIKLNISPNIRLSLMIIFLIISVSFFLEGLK